MGYSPPDSVIVERIQRAFPSGELRERVRATNLVERQRKFDIVALFYTLAFGFAAGSDRSLQAFLERYVEMADCDDLSYTSFHDWFELGFVAFHTSDYAVNHGKYEVDGYNGYELIDWPEYHPF